MFRFYSNYPICDLKPNDSKNNKINKFQTLFQTVNDELDGGGRRGGEEKEKNVKELRSTQIFFGSV